MRRYIFAGGGTGGHLFPGLAIWQALQSRAGGSVEALFVCSDRPLDTEILGEAEVRFEVAPAAPPSLKPSGLLRFVRGWRASVALGSHLLAEDDCEVVALGGFVAAPLVRAAGRTNRRVTLVNLDAVPGKANRLIAGRADRVLSAVPVEHDPGGVFAEVVGMPIRDEARASGSAPACRARLGLEPDLPTLLVTGASQGAASLNNWLRHVAGQESGLLDGWQVLHLAGRRDIGGLRKAYQEAEVPAHVLEFCSEMGLAWGSADAAISRAGAGSVAEAAVNRVPTIFMPYPYHKDQHQRANAERLVQAGGSLLGEDCVDPIATHQENRDMLATLLADGAARQAMRAVLADLEDGGGADRIARTLLEEMPQNQQ